jgi:transcriptional regulator with XRE-family HTH domain
VSDAIPSRAAEFGRYLESLRTAQGLSRPALRDKVRDRFGDERTMSTSTIANWEKGKIKDMSCSGLVRLTVVLGASWEDVFGRLVEIELANPRGRSEDTS